ncbi:MAG TPA: hypothetical protein VF013_00665 [Candidatus Limnocylindria bacterium]
MLDYRLHYAVMAAEDRNRPSREQLIAQNRGVRRVFRIEGDRPQRTVGRR